MPQAPEDPAPEPPRIDYAEAARRHLGDAATLRVSSSIANADHLYGIAAECALVGLLRTNPSKQHLFRADGALASDNHRRHIDGFWHLFCRESDGQRATGFAVTELRQHFPRRPRYPGDRPWPENPFQGWSVDQRYLSNAAVNAEITPETLERHRIAAEVCCRLLDRARTTYHPKGRA